MSRFSKPVPSPARMPIIPTVTPRFHNMPPMVTTHRRANLVRPSRKISHRATPRPACRQNPYKREFRYAGRARPYVKAAQFAKRSGLWKVSVEMMPNTEPITSQTAALTNIKNSGRRHEASISGSEIAETSLACDDVESVIRQHPGGIVENSPTFQFQ